MSSETPIGQPLSPCGRGIGYREVMSSPSSYSPPVEGGADCSCPIHWAFFSSINRATTKKYREGDPAERDFAMLNKPLPYSPVKTYVLKRTCSLSKSRRVIKIAIEA